MDAGSTEKERSASPSKRAMDEDGEVRRETRRESVGEERGTKRTRPTSSADEKGRSKRMFGAILGTLRKFQDEDKSRGQSEAAKRREQTAARIAAKLRSEADSHAEIVATEREIKALRVAAESAAAVVAQKEIALAAQHANLRASSAYLTTSSPGGDPLLAGGLYTSPPLPVARGPVKGKQGVPALFFLPKILTPAQEEAQAARTAEIERFIADSQAALADERAEAARLADENKEKGADLAVKLQRLKEAAGVAGGSREGREDRRSSRSERDGRGDRERDRAERREPRGRRESDADVDMAPLSPVRHAPPHMGEEMEVEY